MCRAIPDAHCNMLERGWRVYETCIRGIARSFVHGCLEQGLLSGMRETVEWGEITTGMQWMFFISAFVAFDMEAGQIAHGRAGLADLAYTKRVGHSGRQ